MLTNARRVCRFAQISAIVAGLSAFTGCGSEVKEETMPVEQPPEITEADNAMENFMKSGGETKAQP